MNPTKSKITDPEAAIAAIQKQPSAELAALKAFLTDCQQRQNDPDPATSIRAEIEAERAESRIADFERWPIQDRAARLADEWVAANTAELVELLRANLAERLKRKDTFLAGVGKRAAELTVTMFAPARDRDQLAAEREKAETEAAALEAAIFNADQAIRMLSVSPSLATFGAAGARVNEVNISVSGSSAS